MNFLGSSFCWAFTENASERRNMMDMESLFIDENQPKNNKLFKLKSLGFSEARFLNSI